MILRGQSLFLISKEPQINLKHLNSKYKAAWTETVENIDMKYSSYKAWTTINKLNEWMNTYWTLINTDRTLIEHCIGIRTEQMKDAFLATE